MLCIEVHSYTICTKLETIINSTQGYTYCYFARGTGFRQDSLELLIIITIQSHSWTQSSRHFEWEDAITVEQTDTGTAFFQTASYDKFLEDGLPKGGFLFKLRTSEDESFRERPEYEYIGFSENVNLHFYLSMPSDYQAYVYDPVIRAEYDEMHRQISQIAEMAKISKSMYFYTDDIVSTDAGMS